MENDQKILNVEKKSIELAYKFIQQLPEEIGAEEMTISFLAIPQFIGYVFSNFLERGNLEFKLEQIDSISKMAKYLIKKHEDALDETSNP